MTFTGSVALVKRLLYIARVMLRFLCPSLYLPGLCQLFFLLYLLSLTHLVHLWRSSLVRLLMLVSLCIGTSSMKTMSPPARVKSAVIAGPGIYSIPDGASADDQDSDNEE